MKKILLIALCLGFTMTQSIQTKQIEVAITQNTESIDISDYLDLVDGYYNVETIYIEGFTYAFEGWMGEIEFSSEINNSDKMAIELYDEHVYFAYRPCIINNENPILLNNSELCPGNECLNHYSGNFIINVTGLFEDELLPPTGDLNSDGEINVTDVVVLVNSILGDG